MNSDFLDAHDRHWADAEMLLHHERLANADHLYGMSAECGLKRLMIHCGMALSDNGIPKEREDKVHIHDERNPNNAWDRFENYRAGYHEGTAYALPSENPFADWDVSQRYANRSEFTRPRVEAHRQGAETVRALIRQAEKEGLI